jgi:hypothetical protein
MAFKIRWHRCSMVSYLKELQDDNGRLQKTDAEMQLSSAC